jgi:carbonic anhydrase/acetyltransferase-like protein (isoleucine patch superfamily)
MIKRILNSVVIGERSVLHTAASLPNGMPATLSIGNNVLIQNDCTLYSCTIGDNCSIGYKSIILEGAKLEDGAVLAPNTVVPPGRLIPAN